MALDPALLVQDMLEAARDSLTRRQWRAVRDYAETEFRKLSESIAFIQRQRIAGEMTTEQARLHLEIQRNAARTVLLTLEGIGVLAAEEAINAALAVVRDAVNSALRFKLL